MNNIQPFPQTYEPKTSNRFIVNFEKPFEINCAAVRSVTAPSFTKTHQYSRIVWNNMIFELYDPITPSTSQAIMDGLRALRERDNQDIHVSIKLLGPVGDEVSEWKLNGEIEKINFGSLDWTKDDFIIITIELKVISLILNY